MKSMRQLINLMEGVTAIPGIGKIQEARYEQVSCSQCGKTFGPGDSGYSHCRDHKGKTPVDESFELDEKSTSEKQARFMAAAAHDPAFAKKTGMDTSVAKEFNKADTGTKQLSNAMKNKTEECGMNEDIHPDMIQELAGRLASGEISYEEFQQEVDSLEQTDYSMRQGEMGLHSGDTAAGHRNWSRDQEQEFGEPDDRDEYDVSDDDMDEESNPQVNKSNVPAVQRRAKNPQGDWKVSLDDLKIENPSNKEWMDQRAQQVGIKPRTQAEEGEMFHPDHDAVHGAMSDSDYNQHQEMQQDAREAFNDDVRGYLSQHYSADSRFSDAEVSEVAAAMGCDEDQVWQAMEDMDLLDGSNSEPGEGGPDNYMDDADALASAGHGSDEDYGDYGGNDFDEGVSIDELFDPEHMEEGMSREMDSRTADRLTKEVSDRKWAEQKKSDDADKEKESEEKVEEDLNNGYKGTKADGQDYFPDGADGPVVDGAGPSGARQGDNPEQKKLQIAEVHKELVYGYRNYLNESAKVESKKKLKESAQPTDVIINDYYGDFETSSDSIDYDGDISVGAKVLDKTGNPIELGLDIKIAASSSVEWEEDESPTGWNYKSDQPTYTTSVYASASTPVVDSVSFAHNEGFYINGDTCTLQEVQQHVDSSVLKYFLNPALYVGLMGPAFDKEAENIEPPEPDFDEPDYGGDDY